MAETGAKTEVLDLGFPSECPGCGKDPLVRDYRRGRIVCDACGLVVEEGLKDRGPEWRAYDQDQREKKSRTGPPSTETIHDKGLSTRIDRRNRDARGKNLPPERRSQMFRLRKWHKWSRGAEAGDRNLVLAFGEIKGMVSRLGLPRSAWETACSVYRKASAEDLVRGRSTEGVTSAAVYTACREGEIPRTLAEVAGSTSASEEEVRRCYLKLARKLDVRPPPADPPRFVSRFCDELGLPGKVKARAVEIARTAKRSNLTAGKNPAGIAGASIYAAARQKNEWRSQRDVAGAAGVTEVTIRNRYKEIKGELELDEAGSTGPSNPGNPGEQSENGSAPEPDDRGSEKSDCPRSGKNASPSGWLEGNLYLYKILSAVKESSKSRKELALDLNLTYPGVEKRIRKLAEKSLVTVKEGESVKVAISRAGERALNRVTVRVTRDGKGNAVVVK